MVRLLSFLVWAAAAALVVHGESTPHIAVFMDFDSVPGAGVVDIMKAEVDHLFRAAGISLDWQMTRDNRGTQAFSKLVVLKFQGNCRAPDGSVAGGDFGTWGETATLAFAKVSRGKVMPYGVVACDQLREALSLLGATPGKLERRRALGVAMGRVAAHELYHMLANTTRHTAHGLAKAAHSMEELLSSDDSSFAAEDAKALAGALRLVPAR